MRAVPNANRLNAGAFVDVFNQYCEEFGINTTARAVHLLCQVAHESGSFRYVEENLNYSASRLVQVFPKYFNSANAAAYAYKPEMIANRVYANRMGNGNEASGDGYRYRGRGYVQITGKEMYSNYQKSGYCVGNLVAHPEWLAKAPGNTKSAMWYFKSHGCCELADRDRGDGKIGEDIVRQITRKINGGLNGISDRLYLYRRFRKELGL